MRLRMLLAAASVGAVVGLWPVGSAAQPQPPEEPRVEIVVFHGQECPHCARALAFLGDLQQRQPALDVVAYEVWHDASNRALFAATAAAHGVDARSVPTIFLGDLVWVGFDEGVAGQIEAAVESLVAGITPQPTDRTEVDVPVVGTVDVSHRPLVVATLLIGFADGLNPCSFWVLSVLLAVVLHSGSRRRTALVGATFLTVTAALYGLYMVGAYSALGYAGALHGIRIAVALVAGTFGVLHLKEYVTHRGPSLTIPAHRKPGMYRRMRRLADTDLPLPAALAGTAVLAVGVSLLETPCSAGLPLLWTDMLAARDVGPTAAAALFGLYLLVFLVDELVLFAVAVATLRATRVQEHHARGLQLLSGSLMVTLAVVMVAAPQVLESVTGTLVLFASVFAVVGFVLLVQRAEPRGMHPARR